MGIDFSLRDEDGTIRIELTPMVTENGEGIYVEYPHDHFYCNVQMKFEGGVVLSFLEDVK